MQSTHNRALSSKTRILNLFRAVLKISWFETILRKLTYHKTPDNFFAKFVPNNYQYSPGSLRSFSNDGINFQVDIHDFVGHTLYFGFKDAAQSNLFTMVEEGNRVLDIGTNVGGTLLRFAQLVGTEGQVFGFEPDPKNYRNCLLNIDKNGFKNVIVSNIGLGCTKGDFIMSTVTESNRGKNRIVQNTDESRENVTIKIDTLDDWISKQNLQQIDLIKIDVEGFELNVLKGSIKTLTNYKPTLFIELDDNNLKESSGSAKELLAFIESLGYRSKNAATNEEVKSTDDFTHCHIDIICRKVLINEAAQNNT